MPTPARTVESLKAWLAQQQARSDSFHAARQRKLKRRREQGKKPDPRKRPHDER